MAFSDHVDEIASNTIQKNLLLLFITITFLLFRIFVFQKNNNEYCWITTSLIHIKKD